MSHAYPLHELPEEMKWIHPDEWTPVHLRGMLRLFVKNIPGREKLLLDYLSVSETGDAETDLKAIGESAAPHFRQPEFSEKIRYLIPLPGLPLENSEDLRTMLTDDGRSLAMDIGLFMAKHLQQVVPEAKWTIEVKKKMANYGSPLLQAPPAKAHTALAMYTVPAVCALKVIDGQAGSDEWFRMFLVWKELFLKAPEYA